MISLRSYQSKIDELKNVHTYIKKKLIILYILFGLTQVLYFGGITIICGILELEPHPVPIILSLIVYLASYLLFIPITKNQTKFTQGNLRELVFEIIHNETGLYFEPISDKKEFNLFVIDNSNITNYNSITPYMYIDIYDENHENIIGKYSFVNISYSKYLAYCGYLIMIPSNLAKGDIKIFTKEFKQYNLNHKYDKENSDDISHIFYNKKLEYVKDENLISLHKEIDSYYNEYLSNKISIGLLSKNNYLSIMFANNPKLHPNFKYKNQLTDEYLESLVNAVMKDIELVKNIYKR